MAPPVFGDLGKAARDVFGKDFHFGVFKLNCTHKSPTGVEVTSGGSHVLESGKVNANLETKYKCSDYGLTITEGWSTENVLNTDVVIDDKIAKGLKLALNTKFTPATGKAKGAIKSTYKADAISINADSTIDACPTLGAAGVAAYGNWLVGGQVGFDTAKSKLTRSSLAVGFSSKDLTLHSYTVDGSQYGGSLHSKVNKSLDAAVNVGFNASSNETTFGLGCKMALDDASSVRAKVDNNSKVGVSYQHKLRPGVTMTLSTLVDAANFGAGGHKVGLALDFES